MRDVGLSRSPGSHPLMLASSAWPGSDEGGGPGPAFVPPEQHTEPDKPARILIVEDELLAAWHVEAMVQDLGHVVCGIVAKGEQAIEAAGKLAPDMVFMDVNLGGGMDGIEAATRIRSKTLLRIVFITAYGDSTTRKRINTAVPGAVVLAKPVSPEAIRRAIRSRLNPADS